MSLVRLTRDERPHNGYVHFYVNPDDVMSVDRNDRYSDNKSVIRLRTGERMVAQLYPDDVVKLLEAKEGAP